MSCACQYPCKEAISLPTADTVGNDFLFLVASAGFAMVITDYILPEELKPETEDMCRYESGL